MPRTPAQNEALRCQRKAQILDAALSAYVQRGYDGADMDDIAARAGVAKGLMYYYYKTKRALFCELFDTMFAQSDALSRKLLADSGAISQYCAASEADSKLLRSDDRALSQAGETRALEALLRYCYGIFAQTKRDPRMIQFCMRVPFDAFAVFGAEGWREGAARAMTHRTALEGLITRAIQQGDVLPGDARMLASSFWTVFVAELFDFSRMMLGETETTGASFLQVTAFCMGGLGVSGEIWRTCCENICQEGETI